MWTRWRCRRRQAVAARTGKWSTGSSTSSGEEDRKSKSQEAEIKELRAQIEHHRKQSGGEPQGGKGLPQMVKVEEPEIQAQKKSEKRPLSNSPSRLPMEEDALLFDL